MRTHVGQYQIEAPLGRGGMGVVYKGVHAHLGRQVAVKALAPELTQQPEFRERFFSEAKTQARLQHPNIVGVYDLLEDGGEYFIVMEFVAGEPLDDRLKTLEGRGMDTAEAVAVFGQVLSALDYAHSEGVIHRDIKPSNVMITAGGRVKLMDFGIALLIGDKRLTASQSAIGTPTYMSPEQIVRPRSVDHRSDIYSAAVVFYEMLSGRPPFDDETEFAIKKLHVEAPPPDLATLNPNIPAGVVEAVSIALAKDPDQRFPSAGAFLRALQEALPLSALPAGATPPPAPVYRPTTLDSTMSSGSARQAAAAPVPATRAAADGGVAAKLLQGKNRWIALAAAAVLVLALGFGGVLLLSPGGGPEGEVAAEGTAPAPASLAAVPAPVPAMAEPQAAELGATEALGAPVQAAPVVPAQRMETAAPPAEPRPAPARRRQEVPAPAAPVTPIPEEAEPAPQRAAAAPAPQPEPDPAPSSSEAVLERLNEMEQVIHEIEKFSKQALDAHEEEEGAEDVGSRLEAFSEGAVGVRKEFRKVTGTGLQGIKSNVKGILRRNRGGQEADTKILEVKAKELVRKGNEFDSLLASSPMGATATQYWSEVRRNLRRLDNFFN